MTRPVTAPDGLLASSEVSAPPAKAETVTFPVWLNRFGILLLAGYCLATSRWGSYLIPGPPYIIDLGLAVLILNRLMLHASGRHESERGYRDAVVAVAGGALFAWTVLRLAAGELTPEALRDAAPYLYCVAIFLVVPLRKSEVELAAKILTGMLLFHLGWVTVTATFGQLPFMPEIPWVPGTTSDRTALFIFGLRPDFDTLAIGLLAALSLHRALSGRRPTVNLAIVVWALAILFIGFDTKAGLLAVGTQLLLAPFLGRTRRRQAEAMAAESDVAKQSQRQARMAVTAILLVAIPLGIFAASDSAMVNNFKSVAGFSPENSFRTTQARGTSEARRNAWARVIEQIGSDGGRATLGVGFGPNYLVDTGANRLLTGAVEDSVRSPHNFWIGTWARTGLIGLTITILLFIAGLRLTFLVIRSGRASDVDVIAILLVIPLTVSATVGVIFESPFGAIPYFWAMGWLAVRACQLGETRPFGLGRHARHPEITASEEP